MFTSFFNYFHRAVKNSLVWSDNVLVKKARLYYFFIIFIELSKIVWTNNMLIWPQKLGHAGISVQKKWFLGLC